MAKFQPGTSGNPSGRPKGSQDKRHALRQLLVPHQEKLVKTLIDFANAGDMSAMRIVMDRLMPPLREDPIRVTLPKIASADDCIKAQSFVLASVAAGELLPSEAQTLSGLIDAQRRAYETNDLAKRLVSVEEILKQKGART